MVMVCFAAGITTRAFFQKAASTGRASGPLSSARRICRSLSERIRVQSVRVVTEESSHTLRFHAALPSMPK
jgi:hypothetical protein